MDGIPEGGFAAFGLLHIFGVSQDRLKAVMLQEVIHQNPVFPGELHTDIFYAIAFKSFGHSADIAVG